MTSQITFNFKGSIIYCYPSKLKHSPNVYFKVKRKCYNMTPFFMQCAKLFYTFQIYNKAYVSCFIKVEAVHADFENGQLRCGQPLLYQPFSGSVNMQQLFVPSIPEYKFFSCRYIVSYMIFLIVMQISLTFSTDIAEHNNC